MKIFAVEQNGNNYAGCIVFTSDDIESAREFISNKDYVDIDTLEEIGESTDTEEKELYGYMIDLELYS